MTPPDAAAITARIDAMIWRSYEAPDEVAAWLRKFGLDTVIEDGDVIVARRGNFVTAISGDPITRAVTMGMALFGLFWPFAVPRLLDVVGKSWRTRRQKGQMP